MFEQVQKKSGESDGKKVVGGANNFVTAADRLSEQNNPGRRHWIFLVLLVFLALIIFGFFAWWLWGRLRNEPAVSLQELEAAVLEQARLDNLHLGDSGDTTDVTSSTTPVSEIEYLSFADFYQAPTSGQREFNFAGYDLPMNVKINVANYYELSRKIDLQSNIDYLNNNGFAVINNPWSKEAANFYSLAVYLDNQQIPLFISADFISYYYQSVLKSTFKEIEEGVFYESLWNINKTLYDRARNRYETHLAAIGNVNDRVLEGERLETAFFAVSLELLQPSLDQIDLANKFSVGKFSPQEAQRFDFTVPAYLSDDVLKELTLIRKAYGKEKSPVLLYDRNYPDFVVPIEYKDNARLHNFYLAAAWLNSVFPLNYRDDSCPECLLDKDDWRINFTAACLISQDFSQNQELKNEWARVYKIISFFKGLRDTWNYVNYHDQLSLLFGEDYQIDTLFAEQNNESLADMEKLRQALLARDSVPMQGALNLQSMSGFSAAGMQFLADFYWPNDFIFSGLRYPQVGVYQGGDKLGSSNVTACQVQRKNQRCQGSGQDVLSLIYPSWQGDTFLENANYANYASSLEKLRPLATEAMNNNLNNYWSSLSLWRYYLQADDQHLPAYLRSVAWRGQMAKSALGAWVDMQLPADKLSLHKDVKEKQLSSSDGTPDYAWVEPNLDFLDRLIAHNQMLLGMFKALSINERSSVAVNNLNEADRQLSGLRAIVEKQARAEDLNSDDNQFIRDFVRAYSVEREGKKSLSWQSTAVGAKIKETLGMPRLLIIAHPVAGKLILSAGPVFDHQESR
jgi:hypothetical protein